MTAQPLRHPRPGTGLRVVAGRKLRRPSLAPWLVFSMVAVVAFLGMALTRTSLDRAAIELAAIETQIADAKSLNQRLRLEIGRLESPARIAPLAAEMGMVYPSHSQRLLVSGVIPEDEVDPRWAEIGRLAATSDEVTAAAADQPQAAAALGGATDGVAPTGSSTP